MRRGTRLIVGPVLPLVAAVLGCLRAGFPEPGDGDTTCTQALCVAGLCCPGGAPGAWSFVLHRCSCLEAGGDADTGGDGDDAGAVACTQALCTAGSVVCCPGASRGVWNTALRRCVCPGPDAGADVDADADVRAEAEADGDRGDGPRDDGRRDEGGHEDPGGCVPELVGGICNIVTQCGCAAGERCVIGPDEMEICTAEGTDGICAECPTTSDNCGRQMQCLSRESATGFHCWQFCYEDRDCPPDRACSVVTPWGAYKVCGPAATDCNPFDGTGCSGAGCGADTCTVDPRAGPACSEGGTGDPGDTCYEGCRPGTGCYTTTGDPDGHCHKFCNTDGGSPDCSDIPGAVCQSLGFENYGVCIAG